MSELLIALFTPTTAADDHKRLGRDIMRRPAELSLMRLISNPALRAFPTDQPSADDRGIANPGDSCASEQDSSADLGAVFWYFSCPHSPLSEPRCRD
jgi:hypothetical protein